MSFRVFEILLLLFSDPYFGVWENMFCSSYDLLAYVMGREKMKNF